MGSGCGGQDKMFLSKRQDFAFYENEYLGRMGTPMFSCVPF